MVAGVNEQQLSGKVIFWSGAFGFIQASNGNTVFFHKTNIIAGSNKRLRLLDEVTFSTMEVSEGKHKGSHVATNVSIIANGKLSDYKRYVGVLTEWNGQMGYIESPQQEQSVLFMNSRKFYYDDSFTAGDYVIFHQVKSTSSPDQLFALFAYSLQKEKDVSFLQQQYVDSQQETISRHIDQIINQIPIANPKKRFDLELRRIGYVDNHDSYVRLVQKIREYDSLGYQHKFKRLRQYCSDVYLIQLWESDHIKSFDLNLLEQYFHKASADKKRFVISKLREENRSLILSNYFNSLKAEGKAHSANNSIKTLLDIVYRNPSSRNDDIYQAIQEHVFASFKPGDIINLWLNGYIDSPPEDFIISNIDFDNPAYLKALLSKGIQKVTQTICNALEHFFLHVSFSDFEQELPSLVNRMLIFNTCFNERAEVLFEVIGKRYTDYQQFMLWTHGVPLNFQATEYIVNNIMLINDFYRVLFFNHPTTNPTDSQVMQLLNLAPVTQEGLSDFASVYQWNTLVHPALELHDSTTHYISFLDNVEQFAQKYHAAGIDSEALAVQIFNALPKYDVHHLRLWLNNWVSPEYFDYVGFRSKFIMLYPSEQIKFKRKGEKLLFDTDVVEPEINEVEPCTDIVSETESATIYNAHFYNIFFRNGDLMLRTSDGSFTDLWEEEMVSSGLNRIPISSPLNQLAVTIEVSAENKITKVEGLDNIITIIHTGEIQRAMGKVENSLSSRRRSNKAYAEDLRMRKQILDFLHEHQVSGIEPVYVYEPKNMFRRLEAGKDIDSKELTTLFTIEVADGKAIIWENSDLSEDRATYIFKTSNTNHAAQISRISDAIVSIAQFRSALISRKEDLGLPVFKASYGFIASIRKRRGDDYSFENWKYKITDALKEPIPLMPSKEVLRQIENWSPEIPHSPTIKLSPKRIADLDISFVNIDFAGGAQLKVKRTPEIINSKQNSLLQTLKSFNSHFLLGLEI